MYKRDNNSNTLFCVINDKLKAELVQLHESRKQDNTMSDTVRYLLWIGLRHHYLFNKTKSLQEKGRAISVDGISQEDQARQADSGIYISKL